LHTADRCRKPGRPRVRGPGQSAARVALPARTGRPAGVGLEMTSGGCRALARRLTIATRHLLGVALEEVGVRAPWGQAARIGGPRTERASILGGCLSRSSYLTVRDDPLCLGRGSKALSGRPGRQTLHGGRAREHRLRCALCVLAPGPAVPSRGQRRVRCPGRAFRAARSALVLRAGPQVPGGYVPPGGHGRTAPVAGDLGGRVICAAHFLLPPSR
jgi:hypothetical protein